MKAIRVHQTGGPEVMKYEEVPLPEPGAGEARVKLEAIGLNFIDTYQRSGIYPFQVPFSPGMEGAGIVDAVGEKVTEVKKGDRVAYAMAPGSYRDYALVPSSKLVPLPQGLDIRSAAAVMLQGMTAHYLSQQHQVSPWTQAIQALVKSALADGIINHLHPLAVGEPPHLREKISLGVENDIVGACLLCQTSLFLG